jgi:hypothetical protein
MIQRIPHAAYFREMTIIRIAQDTTIQQCKRFIKSLLLIDNVPVRSEISLWGLWDDNVHLIEGVTIWIVFRLKKRSSSENCLLVYLSDAEPVLIRPRLFVYASARVAC